MPRPRKKPKAKPASELGDRGLRREIARVAGLCVRAEKALADAELRYSELVMEAARRNIKLPSTVLRSPWKGMGGK